MATVQDINSLFREKGLTLGSVESFTGGLFAREITAVPGASKFYKGALVTYATEEKVRLLGISQEDVDKYVEEIRKKLIEMLGDHDALHII